MSDARLVYDKSAQTGRNERSQVEAAFTARAGLAFYFHKILNSLELDSHLHTNPRHRATATKMSRRKRRNGTTLSDAQKKQMKKDRKREKRRINLTIRDKHTYRPPANLDINQVETCDHTGLFTTVPCQICEVTNCGKQSPGHESPIVIDIRSLGTCPAACAIFFSRVSPYNGTFPIHDAKLNRREIDLNILILALRQLHTFMLANSRDTAPQATCVNQIIVKTNSSWLQRRFFGGKCHPHSYRDFVREFKTAVERACKVQRKPSTHQVLEVQGPCYRAAARQVEAQAVAESKYPAGIRGVACATVFYQLCRGRPD